MNELEKKELKNFDEVEEVEEETERFQVTDLQSANWSFKKIKAFKKRVEEKERLADEEIERLKEWKRKETQVDNQSILFFEALLIEYYKRESEKDENFQLKTPYGKMSARNMPLKYIYNDEAVLNYLKVKKPELVEVKENYNRNKFKKIVKEIEVEGQIKLVDENGEVIDFVRVEEQPKKYSVKVEE